MADLQQVLRKTSLTVTETFRIDGAPVDIDSGLPTLAITKPDGTGYTPLPTVSGSWTGRTTGQYRFVLPRQLECTWLDYELTGNVGGEPQTLGGRVEWVGVLLFTLADLRALKIGDDQPFSSTATPLFTDAQLMEARAATLDEFEHHLGFSPVPRFARKKLHGGDGRSTCLNLPTLFAHKLLSLTINGEAKSTAGYEVTASGQLEAVSNYGFGTPFPAGRFNVVAEWAHGWERVVGDGNVVAMARAAMRLLPGFSSTARSVTTPDGVTYDLGDMAGQITRAGTTRRFGVPLIDSWLQEHRQAFAGIA